MKKLTLFPLLLLGAAFTFLSCGVHDDAEMFIKWDSDNGGTLEVTNTSSKDIVLFHGQVPAEKSIMGGVRAGSTRNIDISKYVTDFDVGGYIILRGMSRDEFNENSLNLAAAKVEFNAMATYRAGQRYRVTIDYNYMGDNAFRVTNNGEFGLELRKNSPEGEKIAYLPKLSTNNIIYTQTTEAITLFPVYVAYNKSNATVITLNATSLFETVTAAPRPANSNYIQTYSFPNDPTLTWEKIRGSLKSPVAYVTVKNNVINQAAYFTNAGSARFKSQQGYDAIGSGEQWIFEVEATEEGVPTNLVATLYGEKIKAYVRTKEAPGESPVIKNGYNYTVVIEGGGQESSGYTAFIEETGKRDLSDQLTSL